MSDKISFDLDDLDDDLIQSSTDFDLILSSQNLQIPEPTLESILKEDDDLDNDEILKNLSNSLTILSNKSDQNLSVNLANNSASSRSSSVNNNLSQNLIEQNGIVCKQTTLKQISSQLLNAIERSDAGLPTVLAVSELIAVGTSRGLVLLFDSNQILKLYITTEHKDAISALSLNSKCDRLLVGNSSGLIFMFDTHNGKLLRKITEAHPLGNAILHLKFTDDSKLACFSDSGGSVFMLEFKRIMGVRSADSTCLFSGSRGEVCHIEPLNFENFSNSILAKMDSNSPKTSQIRKNLEQINNLFNKYSLLAMASFTKIFVVSLRPKLNVLFTFPLVAGAQYLPILHWQFVILQSNEANFANKRYVTPILSCARESSIYFFQIDYYLNKSEENQNQNEVDVNKKFKFIYLKKSDYKLKIYNFCWLNAKTLAILDNTEKLHIFDIKTNEELQVLNNLPECVQLVYNNTFFKSLSTGGYVSEALAFAGENACYQTFKSYLGQLFMLGTKSVNLFSIQNWSSRIDDFINENNLELALDLALSMYKGDSKGLIGLPSETKARKEKISEKVIDILYLYVNRALKQDCPSNGKLDLLEKHYKKVSSKCVQVCLTINNQEVLFDNLYNLLSCDLLFEGYFFESLEDYILDNKLNKMPPILVQNFINYYLSNPNLNQNLEKCLLHFDIENVDLHNVMQMCKRNLLLDSLIYFHNKAFRDYITPFEEILLIIQAEKLLLYEQAQEYLQKNQTVITYGNKLLVYLHCCLCGQSYPYGEIKDIELSDKIRRSLFDYLTSKTNKLFDPEQEYPIIKIFLNFNVLDFLNVISMSFNEPSFEAVIGLDKKQYLIDILINLNLSTQTNFTSSYYSNRIICYLFMFLARQIANKTNNIQISSTIFEQMIEYLCNREELDRIEEREQTLLSLLNSFFNQLSQKFDLDKVLNLALKAKFYRACEIIYEHKGEYYEIIDCYLNDESSLERQSQIFEVARGVMNILYETPDTSKVLRTGSFHKRSSTVYSIEPRDVQLKKLQEKLIDFKNVKKLIEINPIETIYLLWIEMSLDLKYLIKTIQSYNDNSLLFTFIKFLFDLIELIKTDKKYLNYISQFGGEYCELYVDLICRFEPQNLITVLKTSLSEYSFRIDECLRICREYKNWDGAAYLLEKSGQIESAFGLHLEKISSFIKDLQKNLEILSDLDLNVLKSKIDALLIMIVELCQRNSCSLADSVKEKIWFSLFDEVMKPIRSLFINNDSIDLLIGYDDVEEKNLIKSRLEETKEFFKKLGSFIINSMVGYLNLTIIIDRVVCDPLYGASCFGDIKELMIKMLEMCSYEQTLLDKTSNLVSKDVYIKMIQFKKFSSKSFTTLNNYCQMCSRELDLIDDGDLDEKVTIRIYQCGHSFHQFCLDELQIQSCPNCNSLSNQNNQINSKKIKTKQLSKSKNLNKFNNNKKVNYQIDQNIFMENEDENLIKIDQPSTSKDLDMSSDSSNRSIETNQDSVKINDNYKLSLTNQQINCLKMVRNRNSALFKLNLDSSKYQSSQQINSTHLEKQSKLNLAPANLVKFY